MEKYYGNLEQQLRACCRSGQTPLHMPGHKRRVSVTGAIDSTIDFTEVGETDDLHHAEGILKEAMERTAALYGAKRTWYLVNGSTCGNLAGIAAMTRQGDEVVVGRNCHRSIFHALQLRGLKVHWVMPAYIEEYDIYGSLSPAAVEHALQKYPHTRAVILTSPTYEGVISDIASIVKTAHERNIPVFVDEAHGAHLGFGSFPENAVQCGADLVVQSPHKTLFSATQTAWLHLNGNLVSQEKVEQQLGIFETSSPSYPLLMSLDGCTKAWHDHGGEFASRWMNMLAEFDLDAGGLSNLSVLWHDGKDQRDGRIFSYDPGKILIHSPVSGEKLLHLLHDQYRFTLEMAEGNNVLAMTSAADDPAEIHRFAKALHEIDDCISEGEEKRDDPAAMQRLPAAVMNIHDAVESDHVSLPLFEAEGKIAGEYVFLYPPGIPMIVPGEVIEPAQLDFFRRAMQRGYRIRTSESADDHVLVCRENEENE